MRIVGGAESEPKRKVGFMATKITAAKKAEFEEELRYLKNEGRAEVVAKIQEARAFGDLSENYEYKIARDDQDKLNARVAELETILAGCEVYVPAVGASRVSLGSVVTVTDIDTDETKTYELVGLYESDPNSKPKKISDASPFGKALLGHEVGDEVDFTHKGTTITYTIDEIK